MKSTLDDDLAKEESASLNDLRLLLRQANRSLDQITNLLEQLKYTVIRLIGD